MNILMSKIIDCDTMMIIEFYFVIYLAVPILKPKLKNPTYENIYLGEIFKVNYFAKS